MPDGPSAPEIKTSSNPQIQSRVEQRAQELSQLKRYKGKSAQELIPQARSQVATEIWISKIRNMLGRRAQTAEERASIAEANSMTDKLTGVKSRRWYDEQLEAKMKAVKRNKENSETEPNTPQGFYIAIYDIDKLKAWNDHYGSLGADKVIKNVGRLSTRSGEDLARIGGDEFAQLINSDTSEDQILALIRRNADTYYGMGEELVPTLELKPNRPTDSEPPRHTTFSVSLVRYLPSMNLEDIKRISDITIAEAKTQRDSIAISRDGQTVELIPRNIQQPVTL